jgi:hypothetical protein
MRVPIQALDSESAGVVQCIRSARESLFEFRSRSHRKHQENLDLVSEQWDEVQTNCHICGGMESRGDAQPQVIFLKTITRDAYKD